MDDEDDDDLDLRSHVMIAITEDGEVIGGAEVLARDRDMMRELLRGVLAEIETGHMLTHAAEGDC